MKNIFRFLMAVAVLFTASCAKEDISSSIGGGEVEVTFTANLPELGTRAYADGLKVNKLRYFVYDSEGNFLNELSTLVNDGETIDPAKTTTVRIAMLKGMTYNIIFWADKDNLYNFSDDGKVVTVNHVATANDDNRDAFYKYVSGFNPATATANDTEITLTRPFGQLNAATNDYATVANNKVLLTTSTIKVKTFTKLDITTGTLSDEKVFTFDAATMPCMLTTEETLKANYKYLSMNYLLAPANVDVEFVFKGERNNGNGEEFPFTGTTYTNIPLKQNYRTNILGALLTKPTEFNVTIEENFFEPDKDIVQTAAELQQQIENAPAGEPTEIVLGGDINLNDLLASLGTMSTRAAATPSLTIPAGKNITLNLNGCTLSATEDSTGSYALITNKGTLTISDSKGTGKMQLTATENRYWNAYSSVISNTVGGVLTVNGGTIEHLGGTDMAYGIDNLTNGKGTSAVATINGGTVKSTYRAVRQFLNGIEATNSLTVNGGTIEGANKSIWMQDPSANANTGTLVISEDASLIGDVYLFVTSGSTEWPVNVTIANAALKNGATVLSGNVPEGYAVVKENGVWTVKFTHIANIGEQGYDSLKEAVAAVQDGETIVINRNYTFDKNNYTHNSGTYYDGLYYIGDKSFTIDLGGNTIGQNGAVNDYLLNFKNDGDKANTITLKNGTIDAGTAAYCALCTATTSTQKITINLEGVNLVGNNSGGAVAKIRGGAELNVKTGTVITGNNNYVGIEAAGKNTVVNIYEGAKIYQNGTSSYVGSLAGASGGATINVYGGEGVSAKGGFIAMTSGGTINISGGNWTANTDGTYANGNNSVLIAQSEKGWQSTINVTGGTFKGGYNCYGANVGDAEINISGGNFNANPSAYVVAGKAATENNGTWTIIDAVSTAEALVAALAQGGVVTLGADIALTETAVIAEGKSVVLDLNGKTLTAPSTSAFEAKTNGELTIKNGKVVAYESVVRAIGGKVTIESGEFTQTGTAVGSTPATYRYAIDCREGGEIIINGGTFNSGNGMLNVGSKITINGGKFENIVEKSMTRHFAYVSAPITINDGEFYGKANSGAGGCFFCGAAAGGDIQINGGKFTSLWTSGSVNRIFESYYGGTINVTGGLFNTNGGIATFVTENTDAATKVAYPYVAK